MSIVVPSEGKGPYPKHRCARKQQASAAAAMPVIPAWRRWLLWHYLPHCVLMFLGSVVVMDWLHPGMLNNHMSQVRDFHMNSNKTYGATWPDTHQIERALLFTARLAVTRHPVGCCVLSSGWCVLRTELPMAVAVAACQRAVSPRQPIATGCAPNMGAEIGQCPCGEI